MENVYIFGHKNPDTDSIVSSIIVEDLERKMGCKTAKACRIGNVNKETEYALNYFNAQVPELIEEVKVNDNVILVDHNGFAQSAIGIENAKILKVIDHHNISGITTKDPLFYIAMPVGCTATILYDIYVMNNFEISKQNAGLMLSAIISDTLLFKSPTCTQKDIEVANKLKEIAEVDLNEYGLEMLKAGTDLSSFRPEELINIDSKEFNTKGLKYQVAQVNTVSIQDVLKDKVEIEAAMNKYIETNGLDVFIFAITDILENNSQIITLGEKSNIVEKAYNKKLEDNMCFLAGVVSRKKQIVPVIDANI